MARPRRDGRSRGSAHYDPDDFRGGGLPEGGLFDQPRRKQPGIENEADVRRLTVQLVRVYRVMQSGAWHTLREIADATGDPEGSVSARLRDFRKAKWGKHVVERRRRVGGLWEYRLLWNTEVPRPVLEA